MDAIEKEKTVALFGHNASAMSFFAKNHEQLLPEYKDALYSYVDEFIKKGFSNFVTCLVGGVDVWMAQHVIELRRQGIDVKLYCMMLFDGYEKMLNSAAKSALTNADKIMYSKLNPVTECCDAIRTEIIDMAAYVLAVYSNPERQLPVLYAKSQGVVIEVVDPRNIVKRIVGISPL